MGRGVELESGRSVRLGSRSLGQIGIREVRPTQSQPDPRPKLLRPQLFSVGVEVVRGVGGLGSKRLELGSEEFGSRDRVGIREVGRVGVWGGVGFGKLELGRWGWGNWG